MPRACCGRSKGTRQEGWNEKKAGGGGGDDDNDDDEDDDEGRQTRFSERNGEDGGRKKSPSITHVRALRRGRPQD